MKTKSEVKERQIRLTGHEVRAILEGRKTQTRRIIDPQPPASCVYAINGNQDKAICMADDTVDVPERPWFVPPHVNEAQCYVECPYGKPGDRLWVRESFCIYEDIFLRGKGNEVVLYRADASAYWNMTPQAHIEAEFNPLRDTSDYEPKWKPSIHMPRWASRITLEITDVRVERLNDISEEDAFADGLEKRDWMGPAEITLQNNKVVHGQAVGCFRALWESINGKDSWAANPWVWVIEFEKVGA